jgi:hypothetical protein
MIVLSHIVHLDQIAFFLQSAVLSSRWLGKRSFVTRRLDIAEIDNDDTYMVASDACTILRNGYIVLNLGIFWYLYFFHRCSHKSLILDNFKFASIRP